MRFPWVRCRAGYWWPNAHRDGNLMRSRISSRIEFRNPGNGKRGREQSCSARFLEGGTRRAMRLGSADSLAEPPAHQRPVPSVRREAVGVFLGCAPHGREAVFWWAGGSERVFQSPRLVPRLVPPYTCRAEQDWVGMLERLSPSGLVNLNANWTHDAKDLALLLGLMRFIRPTSEAPCVKSRMTSRLLICRVKSAAHGWSRRDISVKAKYNINLRLHRSRGSRCRSAKPRAIGHATPGFDVTARVRVEINEKPTSPELSVSLFNQLPLDLSTAPRCCDSIRRSAASDCCTLATGR